MFNLEEDELLTFKVKKMRERKGFVSIFLCPVQVQNPIIYLLIWDTDGRHKN